jgi:hypothetical protein
MKSLFTAGITICIGVIGVCIVIVHAVNEDDVNLELHDIVCNSTTYTIPIPSNVDKESYAEGYCRCIIKKEGLSD